MPSIIEIVAQPQDLVISLMEDVLLRHEPNAVNTSNNRAFALLTESDQQTLVEVVRRGSKNTRIRRNCDHNTPTELVLAVQLSGYTHSDGRP